VETLLRMKISVLTPVFNEEKHLAEMIQSLVDQTHSDWELLLVDDGSTDSSSRIIQHAAHQDSRIIDASAGHKLGKVRAFNRAFDQATGDLIVLLGGDDRLPTDSLAIRHAAFADVDEGERVVAFFKIRTFSEDPRYDAMTLPKGTAVSRSGGSITMNRELARVAFPIDESLVAEDIWLSYIAADVAERIMEVPEVVLDYRIHAGNSNPRNRPFDEMSEAMHARHRAWHVLTRTDRFELASSTRQQLDRLWDAEELRQRGATLQLVVKGDLPLMDRLAMASMSSEPLYRLRSRFYRLFSGLRGR
jgi:glycosyltransferase involved in cell wall biosynthesis